MLLGHTRTLEVKEENRVSSKMYRDSWNKTIDRAIAKIALGNKPKSNAL